MCRSESAAALGAEGRGLKSSTTLKLFGGCRPMDRTSVFGIDYGIDYVGSNPAIPVKNKL